MQAEVSPHLRKTDIRSAAVAAENMMCTGMPCKHGINSAGSRSSACVQSKSAMSESLPYYAGCERCCFSRLSCPCTCFSRCEQRMHLLGCVDRYCICGPEVNSAHVALITRPYWYYQGMHLGLTSPREAPICVQIRCPVGSS